MPKALRVVRKQEIAADIFAFELAPPEGGELPAFTPGAHVTLLVPNGAERKYSLCGNPAARHSYEIAVRRDAEGRGGSVSLVDGVCVGDLVKVGAPRNNFALRESSAGYVFIAGGIGITPIMSMIRHLQAAGSGSFRLYYCTRTPAATAFLAELSTPELAGRVTFHHDGGDLQRCFDFWPILEAPRGQHIYCCGPRAMMRDVRDMTGHWPSSAVHFESFADAAAPRPSDRPFNVRLARSGQLVEVPQGTTILEALRKEGVAVASSCESGTCGTCRTRLLGGEADHRDFVLNAAEQSTDIMICVSRARSAELVLDL